jgi:hypothetical protein
MRLLCILGSFLLYVLCCYIASLSPKKELIYTEMTYIFFAFIPTFLLTCMAFFTYSLYLFLRKSNVIALAACYILTVFMSPLFIMALQTLELHPTVIAISKYDPVRYIALLFSVGQP